MNTAAPTVIAVTGPDGVERRYPAGRVREYVDSRQRLADWHPDALGAATVTLAHGARLMAAAGEPESAPVEDEGHRPWGRVHIASVPAPLGLLYGAAAELTVELAAADAAGDHAAAEGIWERLQSVSEDLAQHMHRGSGLTIRARGGVVRVSNGDREAVAGIPWAVRRAAMPSAGIFGVVRRLVSELDGGVAA